MDVEQCPPSAECPEPKILYKYKVTKGVCLEQHYGLQLARLCKLPTSLIQRAEELCGRFDEQESSLLSPHHNDNASRTRLIFKLAARLRQVAKNTRLDDATLKSFLITVQQQFRQALQFNEDDVEES
eukprot:m.84753 g.84753  ORF g.84753 m.84753 type:complete len:127 (+) comp21215_c0_seq1:227-607(+)